MAGARRPNGAPAPVAGPAAPVRLVAETGRVAEIGRLAEPGLVAETGLVVETGRAGVARTAGTGAGAVGEPDGRGGQGDLDARPGRRPGAPRLLLLVYWGGAAALAPWIVLLFVEQPKEALAHHLHLVGFGVSALMVVGMLVTASGLRRQSPHTVLGATSTGTLVFITAWFSLLTSAGLRLQLAALYALVVQAPVTTLCVWVVVRLFRPSRSGAGPPAAAAPVLAVGAVALVPLVVVVTTGLSAVQAAHHLRLVWTGLDVFELTGMVATGWCLRHDRPAVAVAASFTGTLLFCDAWFNVVSTTGRVQLAGVAMALLELPLSALSFWVARREVATWASASPRRRPDRPGARRG